MTYYNILQKHSGILMLGQSLHDKSTAQYYLETNYGNERIKALKKKRWEYSKSPPLPLDDYEIVETDLLYTF